MKISHCMRSLVAARSGIALAALSLSLATNAKEPLPEIYASADTVIVNAQIYSAARHDSMSSAMAIHGNKIVAIGDTDTVRPYIGDNTNQLDLDGRLVLPGLHDTHIHPLGIIDYEGCNLKDEPMNLLQLSNFVSACQQRSPDSEDWLVVRQWPYNSGNTPVGDIKTLRAALDRASSTRPIILFGNDGAHHFATNSAGLALARSASGEVIGLSAKTLASEFSELKLYVGVDERGEPNGAVNESVPFLLGAPNIITADIPDKVRNAWKLPLMLNANGITAIKDAAYFYAAAPVYDTLLQSGNLNLRIELSQLLMPELYLDDKGHPDLKAMFSDILATREKYQQFDNISADAIKMLMDGVIEADIVNDPPTLGNAAVLSPFKQPLIQRDEHNHTHLKGYVDTNSHACRQWRAEPQDKVELFQAKHGFHPAQCTISTGQLFLDRESIMQLFQQADALGFKAHLHAIGDRASRVALDAIEATRKNGSTLKHSIAHVQLITDQDIARMAELDLAIVPTYSWAARNPEYDASVAPFISEVASLDDIYQRDNYFYKNSYPFKRMMDAGALLAAGSDAPVETVEPRPFVNIQAAISRDLGHGVLNPNERLNIFEAIDSYTINGAKLMGHDHLTGSLEVGKQADFIVLDRNIIELAEQQRNAEIGKTQVLQTWFGGNQVYQKP